MIDGGNTLKFGDVGTGGERAGNTVDKKETGGVAAEALGTLEHVRAGK